MNDKNPKFNWKPSPQPSAEELTKIIRNSQNVKMSKEFQKLLYMIWADQDRARALVKKNN